MRTSQLSTAVLAGWLCCSSVVAQMPTLNPQSTVNPATGEMGFNMNLGVVQGVNGGDFPIDLYYKAGIRTDQPASPVGLGFGIGPGAISRKVVHVPDDLSAPARMVYEQGDDNCELAKWKEVVAQFIQIIITVVVSVASENMGLGTLSGMAMSMMIGALSDAALEGTLLSFNPADYKAAGTHLPAYDYEYGDRTGFLCGGKQDSPDLYSIQTPYVSGQLVWVGDGANGHFAFRSGSGSSLRGRNAVDVHYDRDADIFLITLQDGTRLYFEKRQRSPWHLRNGFAKCNDEGDCCYRDDRLSFKQASTSDWLLTKVLFADYVDGNGDVDPQNSAANNKGGWLAFEYAGSSNLAICRNRLLREKTSVDGYSSLYLGKVDNSYDGVELHWLSSVITPAQRADYIWVERLDDVWSQTSSRELWDPISGSSSYEWTPYKTKRLDKIVIKNAEATPLRTIRFAQGYDLRPMSIGAFVHVTAAIPLPLGYDVNKYLIDEGNPEARSLTLRSVRIEGADNVEPMLIRFHYVDLDPVAYNGFTRRDRQNTWLRQPRDLWGYYLPNDAKDSYGNYVGDYNAWGTHAKAHNAAGVPWASAWSLESVELPNGGTVRWEYEANRYDMANGVATVNLPGTVGPRYGGGIRVKKVVATDGVGGTGVVTRYFYTAGNPAGAGYFTEGNSNSSGHATSEPYAFFTESEHRTTKARGGSYSPCRILYEQVAVVQGQAQGNVVAPHGYAVYNFTSGLEHPNGGTYGEFDSTWKWGHVDKMRQYSSASKLVQQTTYQRDFVDEPNIYSLPSNADFACAGRWLLLSKQNTLGTVIPRSQTTTTNGVSTRAEYFYATDAVVDEPADLVTYTKDEVTTHERSWGNIGTPDFREGAFGVCKELGDDNEIDVAAVYSLYNAMRVKIYTDFGTQSESVLQTSFVPQHETPSPVAVPRVIGTAFWELNGSVPANPDLIVVVARYTQMECYVFWDVGNGTLGAPTYFPLITVSSDDWEIVSCAITQLGMGAGPELLFYEGDYGETGRFMERSFYGLRDLNKDGHFASLGRTVIMHGDGSGPRMLSGDDIRFIDYHRDGRCDDLEITGPRYEDYIYYNDGLESGILPLEGYCDHYILEDVNITTMPSPAIVFDKVKALPTLFEVGPNDEGQLNNEGAYSLRYIGAAEGQDDGDRIYGFFRWDDPDTYLRLVTVSRKTYRRDCDGLPNRVERSSGGLRIASDAKPAHTVFPQMALRHVLTGNARDATSEISSDAMGTQHTRVVQATATRWDSPALTIMERECTAEALGQPYPPDGASNVELVCNKVLLAWQGIAANGEEVKYEVYKGGLPTDMSRAVAMYEPSSADRVGAQMTVFPSGVTYWQVRAFLPDGRTMRGPIWSFRPGHSRAPTAFGCGSSAWLEILGPRADGELTPGGLTYIRWLGDDVLGTDHSGCHCVIAEYQRPDGGWSVISTGGQICSNEAAAVDRVSRSSHWGHLPWRVPSELAGHQTRIRLRRYCGDFSSGVAAESEPLRVANISERLLPLVTHAWRVPSAASSEAQYAYVPFDFSQSAMNSNWIPGTRITRRGRFSQTVCSVDPNGTPATSIFGHSGRWLSGTVANADYRECGVFTGDYDVARGSWLDYENGWARGNGKIAEGQIPPGAPSVQVVAEAKHLGDKGVKVTNAWGPSRNFRLQRNTNYELSAWLRVADGSNPVPFSRHIVMNVDYRKRLSTTAEEDFPIAVEARTSGDSGPHCSGAISVAEEAGGWKRVVMTIPAKDDISESQWNNGYQYARVWVGCPAGDGSGSDATLYIDDVRFVPTDALASTAFYDLKWGNTRASVDANSNTRTLTYDGFGRVKAVYNDAGLKVQEYDYYRMAPPNEAAPTAPTNLTAEQVGNSVVFRWSPATDADNDLISYNIYVPVSAGVYTHDGYVVRGLGETAYTWTPSFLSEFLRRPKDEQVEPQCWGETQLGPVQCRWRVEADDGRGKTTVSEYAGYTFRRASGGIVKNP